MSIEQTLERLEKDIKRLRVDFRRFFAGDLELPPAELRFAIERRLRRLRADSNLRYVESFRLTQLEARYNSYKGLFTRRLKRLEERGQRSASPATPATRIAGGYDADSGVVIGRSADAEAIESLYSALHEEGGEGGPPMHLDTFRTYIDKQTRRIRDRTGCADVRYRVVQDDGKTKLKAKPVQTEAGGGSG